MTPGGASISCSEGEIGSPGRQFLPSRINESFPMPKRSQAREVAFQVLYQDDLNPRSNPAALDAFITERIFLIAMLDFVGNLPEEERMARPEIDAMLTQAIDSWTLDRGAAANPDELHLAVYQYLRDTAFGDAFLALRNSISGLVGFSRSLVAGTRQNRPEIDAALIATAENWTLDRMAATDRNILRLAAYELLQTDTPRAVAIDEAVELAKRFGSEGSAGFVNGVLDRIASDLGKT